MSGLSGYGWCWQTEPGGGFLCKRSRRTSKNLTSRWLPTTRTCSDKRASCIGRKRAAGWDRGREQWRQTIQRCVGFFLWKSINKVRIKLFCKLDDLIHLALQRAGVGEVKGSNGDVDLTILLLMWMWACWAFIQARVLGPLGLQPWLFNIGLIIEVCHWQASSLMTEKHTPYLFTRNSYHPSYPNQAYWTLRGEEGGSVKKKHFMREYNSVKTKSSFIQGLLPN